VKVIVLAAGKGTRMKSNKVKVLHALAGKPMVSYILDTLKKITPTKPYLIIGYDGKSVQEKLQAYDIEWVIQKEQLGTGHAVMCLQKELENWSDEEVVVLPGDCPLITQETLTALINQHRKEKNKATILTVKLKEPGNYGRILRERSNKVMGIREARDCNKEQIKINEVNSGIYVFTADALSQALKEIKNCNAQNEYYLTDVIEALNQEGQRVGAYCTDNIEEVVGINDRVELARINKHIYRNNNIQYMQAGVTILDPETVFIDSSVRIGRDTVIAPFCIIKGQTIIEEDCEIGANVYLDNVKIKQGSIIAAFSKLENFQEA
jgi:bifunctional UDP-N-acetylglucosamine pyrophosphorylase/glucosamine-1-phosphate N-acetyltransferase